MKKPRIGAVSYLNTKPLVEGLPELAPDWEIVFDLPSHLADGLRNAEYQVALIPSVEAFQLPHQARSELAIISDARIG